MTLRQFGPQPTTVGPDLAFYECGCCGCYHPAAWDGDCRDDNNRFYADEIDARFGLGWIEVVIYEDFETVK